MFRQSPRAGQAPPLRPQRRSLFVWLPVALGLGIVAYFALRVEPQATLRSLAWVLGLGLLGLLPLMGRGLPWAARGPTLLVAAAVLGFALAASRTHGVAAPVLETRYYGPIEGRIVLIDRSESGALRLTLDRVFLGRMAPWKTPQRVRVSLHWGQDGQASTLDPAPGQIVMLTGHLSPPAGPVEPGGFDFRRLAWFDQLGAVGYARTPALLVAPPARATLGQRVYAARLALAAGLQARLPGAEGGFAAAILTGLRAGLDPTHVENLRQSNLAHLLAISGLHMGLLTGAVFFGLRFGLALWPALALRAPIRKMAALGALVAAFCYLHMAGASVATQRAFIMAAMMLGAVCLDRRAFSLHSVAWAALIVLVLRPESLMGAGFQMSFAATAALVVVFGLMTQRRPAPGLGQMRSWALGVALSSFVAGLATAPFAAAHFNLYASYGLLANLAAVPVMGLVIMPGALLALALLPVGAEGLGLWLMERGIAWVLWVAEQVAGLEGAARTVPAPQPIVLPLIVLGGLWLLLEPSRWRGLGLVPILAGLLIWTQISRPPVLISPGGGLIGVLTPQGRVISREVGESFAATSWLQNDGDAATQAEAHARAGLIHARARSDLVLPGLHVVQLRGRAVAGQAAEVCAPGVLLVVTQRQDPPLRGLAGGCRLVEGRALAAAGALALTQTGGQWQIDTGAAQSGQRPWTGARPPGRAGSRAAQIIPGPIFEDAAPRQMAGGAINPDQ